MTQYQELLARKRELDKTIEQIRRTESAAALKTVHELIATFGFTAQQVFPFQPVQKKKVQAKYYDPETGNCHGQDVAKRPVDRGQRPRCL